MMVANSRVLAIKSLLRFSIFIKSSSSDCVESWRMATFLLAQCGFQKKGCQEEDVFPRQILNFNSHFGNSATLAMNEYPRDAKSSRIKLSIVHWLRALAEALSEFQAHPPQNQSPRGFAPGWFTKGGDSSSRTPRSRIP